MDYKNMHMVASLAGTTRTITNIKAVYGEQVAAAVLLKRYEVVPGNSGVYGIKRILRSR